MREAERHVSVEVDERLAAAASNRSLWPLPIRTEVAKMEQRLEALQVGDVAHIVWDHMGPICGDVGWLGIYIDRYIII